MAFLVGGGGGGGGGEGKVQSSSSLSKTLSIQAIINPRPPSSLLLIEAGRKSKKVTIIGLNHY